MRVAVGACLDSLRAKLHGGDALSLGAEPTRLPAAIIQPSLLLELAKERLAADDAQGALEAAEAAVERSDGHPQYLRMLGGICMRLGYHRKAAEPYEQLFARSNVATRRG